MKIQIDRSSTLTIETLGRGAANYVYDFELRITFCSESLTYSRDVWVGGVELKAFIKRLNELTECLKGDVSLVSESFDEFLFRIKSVDSLGHLALQIELGKQTLIGNEYFWSKLIESFPLDVQTLESIAEEFTNYFSED